MSRLNWLSSAAYLMAPEDGGGSGGGVVKEPAAAGGDGGAAAGAGKGGDGAAAAGGDKGGKGGDGEGGKGGGKPAAGGGKGAAAGGGNNPAAGGEGEEEDPDAWRKELAGDDEKLLGEARRHLDRKSILKSLVETKTKLRTRNLGPVTPPKDATPEQLAQWREDAGIPAHWKDYGVDGLDKLPEAQRKTYEGFLEAAHAKNIPPGPIKEAVGIYREIEAKAMDEMVERDLAQERQTIETLEDEWGGRVAYRQNTAMADNFLADVFGEAAPLLMKGRLADGTVVGNSPIVVKAIAQLAREAGYTDSFVPGGDGNPGKSMDDRIAEIKAAMGTGAYWTDPKMRDEYARLVTAKAKRDARA